MKKVSFFSSPIGLGHATRDDAIAKLFDNISLEIITGVGAAQYFKKLGCLVHDKYKPPSFAVKNGMLQKSLSWLWQYYKYYKECKQISSQIIKESSPDLIVSDEDFASLTISQERKIPNILITDILETKFTRGFASIIEKKMNQSMNEIIKRCNAVIIPEDGKDEDNLYRVGPIVRKTNHSREELRKKLGFTKKTITISVGGTDGGRFLIEKTLESIKKSKDVDVVVVSGPSLAKKYDDVRNLGFVENLHEIIYASDLLISLAGKSTIDEAKAYGTPGIFIPIKDHFEQEDNARAEGYSFDDLFRLDELIPEKLEQKRNQISFDGAEKACKIIKSYL